MELKELWSKGVMELWSKGVKPNALLQDGNVLINSSTLQLVNS